MSAVAWLFLGGAIGCEVSATLSLRMAVKSRPVWYVAVALGYVAAFVLFTFALADGMALSVAYGIWAATGVALTAVLGAKLFKEPFTRVMGVGICLVVGGVLLVELGAAH